MNEDVVQHSAAEESVATPANRPAAPARNIALERLLWGLLIAILVGVSGVSMWRMLQGRPPANQPLLAPPEADEGEMPTFVVPDFSLIDHRGQPVTLADLKGQIWVADLFFTHCPSVCTMVTTRMRDIQKSIPDGAAVKLVSITVDPDRDTPDVLADYAKQFGAKDDRWLFLTGDKQAIIELAQQGLKQTVTENPDDHSVRLTLVDRDGTIRGWYDGRDERSVGELKRAIKLLDAEIPAEAKP